MEATELLKFLGHSSTYSQFDDYLTQNGIKDRPKIGKSLNTIIPIKGQGLSMSFDISPKEHGVLQKSDGIFVFVQLEIWLSDESNINGTYSGSLPYDLQPTDSRNTIEDKITCLKRRMPDIDNYFIDEIVWTVAFEGDKLEFLQLSVPSDGKRKYGLCP